MNKFLFLLVGVMSYGYAKDFSEQMIMIKPVSWGELQELHFANTKTLTELSISETCPSELIGFQKLKFGGTFFKEVLWTHYVWTEFVDKSGSKCLIKHEKMDFFSNQGQSADLENYEILSSSQAQIFLSAAERIGFDEKGIEILSYHIGQHNQAIKEKPYLKYGGSLNMGRFMKNNKPEFISEHSSKDKTSKTSFLDTFESYYSQETLKILKKGVEKQRLENEEDRIYPFNSFLDLLELTEKGLISLKESKKK